MATLADSFLDDLDELGESSDEEENVQQEQQPDADAATMDGDKMEVRTRLKILKVVHVLRASDSSPRKCLPCGVACAKSNDVLL